MPARARFSATKRKKPEPSIDHAGTDSSQPEDKKVRWDKGSESQEHNRAEATSDDETSISTGKVYLAAVSQLGRVGCSYYDPIEGVIRVMEDTQESRHFDLIKMVLDQASPDIVLTSSRSDEELIDALREYTDRLGVSLQIRPFKEFTPTKGRSKLLSLRLLTEFPVADESTPKSDAVPTNAYEFMQHRKAITGDPATQRWNASIRLSNFTAADSSPLCMSSIGALIDHLVRERVARDLDDDQSSDNLDIRGIQALSLSQEMQMNADALHSLQIFESESHASVHSDRTKEGLSLFGTLNATQTTLGRALLRTWLLRPSMSIPVITDRHDAVECFLLPENLASATVMQGNLKGIKNVPKILGSLKVGKAKLTDWQDIVKFAFHATMLKDALSELHLGTCVNIVKKLLSALHVASFKELGTAINEIIDWEESATSDRVCVRPHIDEELDNRKHVYHGIDSVLSKVAEQIATVVPPTFSSLNVVYFPQLGYLICLPMLEEWQSDMTIHGLDDWTFQFSSA
ncbi:hypothetical protein HGRIS_006377 [Hohenbuehelia grisea]|uniref:DNA mismatch repair protein MutS core domain-containing protein n=1 Tax=Hohenbuehelia grisea TaxID=104357 RepID=A0ABR3K0M5_9AGAR